MSIGSILNLLNDLNKNMYCHDLILKTVKEIRNFYSDEFFSKSINELGCFKRLTLIVMKQCQLLK